MSEAKKPEAKKPEANKTAKQAEKDAEAHEKKSLAESKDLIVEEALKVTRGEKYHIQDLMALCRQYAKKAERAAAAAAEKK